MKPEGWGMVWTILSLAAVVLAAAGAIFCVRRRNSQEEPFYFFRCTQCGQKVRYLASKAGREGMCPRCGQRWTLPRKPQIFDPAAYSIEGYELRVGQRRMPTRSQPFRPSRRAG
jgi:DNA-directed RNA polymerase subunit RPC12/RpoP